MPPRPAPAPPVRLADVVLTPWVPLSIALLVVNDHLLKTAFPGLVTGKLSDLLGLAFFPVLLGALVELVTRAFLKPRAAVAVVVVTGLVFAATKIVPSAALAYGQALGLLQWPVRALFADGAAFSPAQVVVDPTDLFTLPALWLPLRLLRARARLSADAPPT